MRNRYVFVLRGRLIIEFMTSEFSKTFVFCGFARPTLIRKASIFESLHLGRRFRKPPFSWVKVSVTIGENAYKSMRFQTKTD